MDLIYDGAFEQLFGPERGGGNLNKNFPKIQMPGGLPRGMLKLRFDWYIAIGKNFFSRPPNKLGAANRETISKEIWMKDLSILKLPFAFFRYHNIPVLFDHGSFCSKRNKENGTILFDKSGSPLRSPPGKGKETTTA